MRIIILGANLVGCSLARLLLEEGHDIVMIDESRDDIRLASERLDIKCIVGRASYPDILAKAEVPIADIIIAVTDNDEVNMVACQVAYSLFNTKYKIARVHSPHYHVRDDLYGDKDLPIDVFINPERLISRAIKGMIRYPETNEVISFLKKSINVCLFDVPQDYDPHKESGFPDVGQLYLKYDDCWQRVGPKDLLPGREAMLVVFTDLTAVWLGRLFGKVMAINSIMILGANKITEQLLPMLDPTIAVKVVETDKEKAQELAAMGHKADILNGDPADYWFLKQEGIEDIDVFIALTEDDEDNLIACLQAKSMGVGRTFANINRLSYANGFAQTLIDNILSPNHIVASQVIASLYKGELRKTRSFNRGECVIVEWYVSANSIWVGRNIRDIDALAGTNVLVVSHGNDVSFVPGDNVIQQGMEILVHIAHKHVAKSLSRISQTINTG